MDIKVINKMLGSNYPTIESFELNATWEKDIKGKGITTNLINTFPHKIDWDYLFLLIHLFSRHSCCLAFGR